MPGRSLLRGLIVLLFFYSNGCSSSDDTDAGEGSDAQISDAALPDAVTMSDAGVSTDAQASDTGNPDAGFSDAAAEDAALLDGGGDGGSSLDAMPADGSTDDSGLPGDGGVDAGPGDSATSDAAVLDAAVLDAAVLDAAALDAAALDAAVPDAAEPDAGPTDGGMPCTVTSCAFAPYPSALNGLTDRATTDVVLLDADGDLDLDIVWVSQFGFSTNDPPGGVDLSINEGSGTYQHQVVDDTTPWLFGLGVDVNGDEATDVVVSRAATTGNQVGLFLSDGAGTLTPTPGTLPLLSACGTNPCTPDPATDLGYVFGRIASGDFDQDGDMDLFLPVALSTDFGSTRPSVILLNDATGQFTADSSGLPALAADQEGTFCAVAGDLTGDEAADLFVGAGNSRPRLLVNDDTSGSFGTFLDQSEDDGSGTPRIPDVPMRAFKCDMTDIDDDGDQDVVVVNDVEGTVTTPAYLFINDGSGYLTAEQLPSPPGGPYDNQDTAFGDIDGDGRTDIIIGSNAETVTHNGHAVEILLQQPDHSFLQVDGLISLPDNVFGVEVTDVDGDGNLDIVLGVSKYEPTGPGNLTNIILRRVP